MLANLVRVLLCHHSCLDPDYIEVEDVDGHVCGAVGGSVGVGRSEGEIDGGVVDSGQIDGSGGHPLGGVVGEGVAVQVLSGSPVEVLGGDYYSEVKGSARAFSFDSVEEDSGGGEDVISSAWSAFPIEVLVVVSVGVGENIEEERQCRMGRNELAAELGGAGGLLVEIGDLDVGDEVLVGVGGEEFSLEGVQEGEIAHEVSVDDGSVVGGVEGLVVGGEDHEIRLGSQLELASEIVVLEGDGGEGLGSRLGEVERQLDVQLGDVGTGGVLGISVQRPVHELGGAAGAEDQFVDVDVDVGVGLVHDLHPVSVDLVDFGISRLDRRADDGSMAEAIRPEDLGLVQSRGRRRGQQLEKVNVQDEVRLGPQVSVSADRDGPGLVPSQVSDFHIQGLDAVI